MKLRERKKKLFKLVNTKYIIIKRSDLLTINDYASRVSHLIKDEYTSVRY